MAVQPESLEVLDKAQFPAVQARAIVRAIEIEIGGARDALATKQDVFLLHQDTTGLHKDVDALRVDVTGLRKDVDALRVDVTDLRKDVDALRVDVTGLRADLNNGLAAVRGELTAEIHKAEARSTRQLLGSTLTLMSMLVAIFTFLLIHGGH